VFSTKGNGVANRDSSKDIVYKQIRMKGIGMAVVFPLAGIVLNVLFGVAVNSPETSEQPISFFNLYYIVLIPLTGLIVLAFHYHLLKELRPLLRGPYANYDKGLSLILRKYDIMFFFLMINGVVGALSALMNKIPVLALIAFPVNTLVILLILSSIKKTVIE
jgi:hypothetical protein